MLVCILILFHIFIMRVRVLPVVFRSKSTPVFIVDELYTVI